MANPVAEVPKKKLILFLVGSTLLITFTFYFYQILFTPNVLVDRDDRLFIIKPGATYRQVLEDLGRGKFVNDMVSFGFLARLYGYDKSIKPGRYLLQRNMTNIQAIRLLRAGIQEPVNITFTHVRLISELGEKITKNLGIGPGEFYQALNEFIAVNKEGFTKDNILCMFIPNTYEVYYDISAKGLVERMNAEYKRFWNGQRARKADSLGLSPIEVSILASIVQAEAVKDDEAPLIAGLYLNRLKKGIPLQADPTLVFAVGDFSLKRVLNEHKEVDSPYNTYRHAGLTPGPINMPRIVMIDAVLNARQHDYLYMCAKEDFSGYHNFSATLAQHLVNARNYQRALTIEQRKGKALRNR
ncbi:MAG: endolytic transglycosylase MltG [Cyclobacteriaceae bacterium]|nr:endolytic transglycosylase MltG [Cyclobacteriaceae bacterium]MCB0500929.1 endolytic transglycosylase MltG [Cyclobacteriaceae bacterium]MCB9237560.1 endolytic transglycosylase MltG [Flammeovirgaceae bacterium]MCO5270337.1 endolytic transglycosylase MltG [Cyclobacteriaceae bacterium]MCW5902314.1 endolytic transglycosylase MltG [Cyclobacteriaceae bacterium]